jgi:hypothetical protein
LGISGWPLKGLLRNLSSPDSSKTQISILCRVSAQRRQFGTAVTEQVVEVSFPGGSVSFPREEIDAVEAEAGDERFGRTFPGSPCP